MSYSQSIVLLKKITFIRLVNFIKLYSSFILSRLIKSPIIMGQPIALSIEPTTACNLGCPECPSGLKKFSRKTGNLSVELNQKIIDQLQNSLIYINYYFQGEPYINPNFFDFIKYASERNIFCSTSTNGHFLNDNNCKKTIQSGLKQLIISIDGNDQESYEQYRKKGNYEEVIKGVKNIVKWKKKMKSEFPVLVLQFLVVKTNEHLVENMKSLSEELGLNEFRMKTAQFYNYENGNSLMPENQEYTRYIKQANGKYKLNNKLYNHCWRMWSSAVITVNGEVVPCCFDKDANYKTGNLNIDPFKEIWHSKVYNAFRGAVLKNRKEIEICKNCSEGTKIWA
jgi:radical SAM protein with 4Fe4S-binding SPASM domain